MKIKNAVLILLCAATLSSSLDAGPGDLWRSLQNYIQSFNRPRLPRWLKRPQLTTRQALIGAGGIAIGGLAIAAWWHMKRPSDAKGSREPLDAQDVDAQDAKKSKATPQPIIRHKIVPSLNQNDLGKEPEFKEADIVKLINVDASDSRKEYLNQTGMVLSISADEKNLLVYFRDFNEETQLFPKDNFKKISSITDYSPGPFSVGSEKIQQENLDKEPEFKVGDVVKFVDQREYDGYLDYIEGRLMIVMSIDNKKSFLRGALFNDSGTKVVPLSMNQKEFKKVKLKSVENQDLVEGQDVIVKNGNQFVAKVISQDNTSVKVRFNEVSFDEEKIESFSRDNVFIESNESVEPSITINNPQEVTLIDDEIPELLLNSSTTDEPPSSPQ